MYFASKEGNSARPFASDSHEKKNTDSSLVDTEKLFEEILSEEPTQAFVGLSFDSTEAINESDSIVVCHESDSVDNEFAVKVSDCPVCVDGESGKHLHYGGKACHSCRGFFRRSVQSNQHHEFQCKGKYECLIRSKSRKSCKACRFRRCVSAAGLHPSLVMSAEQRRDRMSKRTKRETANEWKRIIEATGSLLNTTTLSLAFDESERQSYFRLGQALHDSNHAKSYEFFSAEPHEFDHFVRTYYLAGMVNVQLRTGFLKKLCKIDEIATKNFCFNLTEMARLSPSDRMTLIGANFGAINGLQMAWSMSGQEFETYIDDFISYGRKNRDSRPEVGPVLDHWDGISSELRTGEHDKDFAKYFINVCNLCENSAGRQELEAIYASVMPWVRKSAQGRTDPVLNVLLCMVMLFDAEGLEDVILEDRLTVAKLRDAFVKCTERYVAAEYVVDCQFRFPAVLRATKEFRRFFDLHRKRIGFVAQ